MVACRLASQHQCHKTLDQPSVLTVDIISEAQYDTLFNKISPALKTQYSNKQGNRTYHTWPALCTPITPSQPIGRIACTHNFPDSYLRLPSILNGPSAARRYWWLNNPFCSEWGRDSCRKDCRCFWKAQTTHKNCPFPLGDLHPHLIHGPLGPPESSSKMACRLVQPFLQAHRTVSHYCTICRYISPKISSSRWGIGSII